MGEVEAEQCICSGSRLPDQYINGKGFFVVALGAGVAFLGIGQVG